MRHISRRSFIKNTSASAAAIGALSVLPRVVAANEHPTAATPFTAGLAPALSTAPGAPTEAFAVFVRTPATGELTLLVGDGEVVVTDPSLVQRLWDLATA